MSTPHTRPPSHLLLLQSLLHSGHRPIRFRPGSLVRWGVAFAFLAWTTDPLLRLPQLAEPVGLQALVAVVWLGGILALTSFLDWQANKQIAWDEGETLPFVHAQVIKVWWLLLTVGVLYTGSTFFFGGNYQTYMVWLTLIGLGLFVHGLFSQELVEWAGASLLVLAVMALMSGLPFIWHRALVISTAGIGMPMLGWLLHRSPVATMALLPLAWRVACVLVASVLPAMAVVHWQGRMALPDDIPLYSREELLHLGAPDTWPRHVGLQVPAGTAIELELGVQGNILKTQPGASGSAPRMTYVLTQDVVFLMIDGQPSRYVRQAGGQWLDQAGWLRITQLTFMPDLVRPEGALVRGNAQVQLGGAPQ